jgi:hypothetical protein
VHPNNNAAPRHQAQRRLGSFDHRLFVLSYLLLARDPGLQSCQSIYLIIGRGAAVTPALRGCAWPLIEFQGGVPG